MIRRKIWRYGAVLACGVLAVACLSVTAGEPKGVKGKSAPSGSWAKKDAEVKIEFAGKDELKIAPHGDEGVLVVRCSYTFAKGKVKAKITGFDGKAKDKASERIPVGSTFNFTWAVKGDTATLDNVTGEDGDLLRSHLEGTYEKK